MELILRFNDGVHGSVAVILQIPIWLPLALTFTVAVIRALPFEFVEPGK